MARKENLTATEDDPHAFLELELVRCVTLQSQGDSFRGPHTISKDHQLTDLTLAACPPPSFPVSGLAASRSCGLAEWGSESGDRGPGPGGSAARIPSRGSGFLPRGRPAGASRPGPHINGVLDPDRGRCDGGPGSAPGGGGARTAQADPRGRRRRLPARPCAPAQAAA